MKYFKTVACLFSVLLCLFCVACAKDPCADGHLFENWDVTQNATCATEGLREATCTRCGAAGSEVIPATGQHRLGDFVVEKAATLFEKGERKQYCKRCEQCINQREIPAISETVAVERDEGRVTLDLSQCAVVYDGASGDCLRRYDRDKKAISALTVSK